MKFSKFGALSLGAGAVAVVLAVTARYAASIYTPTDWFVTEFIERHGLWKPGTGALEARAETIFTLTEENAIVWCYAFSIVFSLLAILSSYVAEWRDEDSLLYSAGYILGAMGFVAINWKWGLPALLASGAVLLVLRHARREL
jgi:hypothetical protein